MTACTDPCSIGTHPDATTADRDHLRADVDEISCHACAARTDDAERDIRRTASTTETGGEEEFTETAPTFELGTSWQVDKTTTLGVSIYRRTLASALQGQSSSDSTGLTVTASKAFPRGFFTSIDYSLENSSYTDSQGQESDPGAEGGISGTPEFYHRLGVSIGRQKQLRGTMSLSASLFYQYSLSESDNPLDEFDQSVVGLRLGLDF